MAVIKKRKKKQKKKTLQQLLGEDIDKSERRARENRAAYLKSTPSDDEIRQMILDFLLTSESTPHDQMAAVAERFRDEGSRRVLLTIADGMDYAPGASMHVVISLVQRLLPGTPWKRIQSVWKQLIRGGRIDLDEAESRKRGQCIYRIPDAATKASTDSRPKSKRTGTKKKTRKRAKRTEPKPLTKKQLEALNLKKKEGMTVEQIGAHFGTTKQAGSKLLQRAEKRAAEIDGFARSVGRRRLRQFLDSDQPA